MFAAAAIASNSSAGRTQPDADDDAASGAGTTGASIVAGAGLPAKADVAAIANAVARAIFFILLLLMLRNVLVSWDTIFCDLLHILYLKLMSVRNHFV